jgi:hypothetical protein
MRFVSKSYSRRNAIQNDMILQLFALPDATIMFLLCLISGQFVFNVMTNYPGEPFG